MIITCPNCNKKFKIDNSLIPDEGRNLQCGSCTHVWLYKIEEENSKILKLKDEIGINDIETKVDKNNQEIVGNKNPIPKIEKELMAAAYECGYGRVIAGFHYPSDFEIGNLLGEKMYIFMNKEDYKKANE